MAKALSLLLTIALLVLIGCGDSTTDPDVDPDGNPTVADYTGTDPEGGMNMSGFYDIDGTDTLEVERLITLGNTDDGRADRVTVASGGPYTRIMLEMTGDDVVPVGSDTVDLTANLTIRIPGSAPGTYVWKESTDSVTFEILFQYEGGSAKYDDVINATITTTKNDPDPFVPVMRSVAGTFSAVVMSPEGRKIAVKGAFEL